MICCGLRRGQKEEVERHVRPFLLRYGDVQFVRGAVLVVVQEQDTDFRLCIIRRDLSAILDCHTVRP
jgi:hypothetical protein